MSLLSPASEAKLQGVHPDLVKVVRRAAEIVPTLYPASGFDVTEGVRTIEHQRELVASGASHTMNSRHLTGHAVDLAATLGGPGKVRWDWALYYRQALAMRRAAMESRTPVEWGGCWISLLAIADSENAMAKEVAKYAARARTAGQKPLLDGPHFQLAWSAYPLVATS